MTEASLQEPQPTPVNNGLSVEQPLLPLSQDPSSVQNPEENNPKPTSLFLKIFLILVVTVVVAYISLFVLSKFTDTGIKDAGVCFQIETEIGNQEYENIKNIDDPQERVAYFCKTDTESLTRLVNCLEQVKIENSLSMSILEAFPKYTKTLTDIVNAHNAACPNSPVNLPE